MLPRASPGERPAQHQDLLDRAQAVAGRVRLDLGVGERDGHAGSGQPRRVRHGRTADGGPLPERVRSDRAQAVVRELRCALDEERVGAEERVEHDPEPELAAEVGRQPQRRVGRDGHVLLAVAGARDLDRGREQERRPGAEVGREHVGRLEQDLERAHERARRRATGLDEHLDDEPPVERLRGAQPEAVRPDRVGVRRPEQAVAGDLDVGREEVDEPVGDGARRARPAVEVARLLRRDDRLAPPRPRRPVRVRDGLDDPLDGAARVEDRRPCVGRDRVRAGRRAARPRPRDDAAHEGVGGVLGRRHRDLAERGRGGAERDAERRGRRVGHAQPCRLVPQVPHGDVDGERPEAERELPLRVRRRPRHDGAPDQDGHVRAGERGAGLGVGDHPAHAGRGLCEGAPGEQEEEGRGEPAESHGGRARGPRDVGEYARAGRTAAAARRAPRCDRRRRRRGPVVGARGGRGRGT